MIEFKVQKSFPLFKTCATFFFAKLASFLFHRQILQISLYPEQNALKQSDNSASKMPYTWAGCKMIRRRPIRWSTWLFRKPNAAINICRIHFGIDQQWSHDPFLFVCVFNHMARRAIFGFVLSSNDSGHAVTWICIWPYAQWIKAL